MNNIPPHSNGLIGPHVAPRVQPPLPPQQPGPSSLDVSQSMWDTHLNNTRRPEAPNNVGPFPITASNIPRRFVQNVDSPSQPSLTNGQLSPWDLTGMWPLLIPSRSSTTQNASACPTCPSHPSSAPVQFGGEQPAPAVQDLTAPSTAAPSSSSFPNPTALQTAPPVPETILFRPGAANAGPSNARRPKRARPRRAREVPLVRIEDRIEWVSRDVMKMTLWFNWSPDAETEAHEAWE